MKKSLLFLVLFSTSLLKTAENPKQGWNLMAALGRVGHRIKAHPDHKFSMTFFGVSAGLVGLRHGSLKEAAFATAGGVATGIVFAEAVMVDAKAAICAACVGTAAGGTVWALDTFVHDTGIGFTAPALVVGSMTFVFERRFSWTHRSS